MKIQKFKNLVIWLGQMYRDGEREVIVTAPSDDDIRRAPSSIASIYIYQRGDIDHYVMVSFIHTKGISGLMKAKQTLSVWKDGIRIASYDATSWKGREITNCALKYLPEID